MPIHFAQRPALRQTARQVERFADLLRKVPVARDVPPHPAIGPMLRSFRKINRAMATRDKIGYVSVAQQTSIGEEFRKIGDAFLIWPKKARKRTRR